MKRFKSLSIFVLLQVVVCGMFAQMPIDSDHVLWRTLNDKVQRKVNKADKYLSEANELNKVTETYEKQIEALRNDAGRIQMSKIRRLERKRNNSVLQSMPYFYSGYTKGYSALATQIAFLQKQSGVADANVASAKNYYKQGRKLFNRADRLEKPERKTELIVLGNQKMREALSFQLKAIEALSGEMNTQITGRTQDSIPAIAVPVNNPVLDSARVVSPVVVQNIPPVADTSVPPVAPAIPPVAPVVAPVQPVVVDVVAAPVAQTVAPVAASAKPDEPNVVTLSNVFISIQIMASQTAAPPDQIKLVYSGGDEVMELHSGDYYRYAVGKFRSVEEAKAAMSARGIKGIVVAFRGSDRIPVAEALAELSKM